ncbi:MAG: ABC transporter permease [Cyanobacteria bacterium TGS_CYA1]|nr:ABC transporter permease [Cyanobacteria bacterium TGS_CYA1]
MTVELKVKISSNETDAGSTHNPAQMNLADARRTLSSLEGFLGLWQIKNLIFKFVWRDFEGRFKGSLLGAVWPLLNPLGHLVLYTFLFSIVLQVRFGGSNSTANFALYLMTAYIPWTAMSEAISSSTTRVLEVPNLVKRVVFPLEILPLVLPISTFINAIIGLALVVAFAFFQMGKIQPTVLLLPVVLIPHFLFTAGLCWILASIGVFIRDCKHFTALALAAGMYITPIVYPAERLPENLRWLLYLNPVSGMITDYRKLLLEGQLPEITSYVTYSCVSVLVCAIGFHFFYKTKNSFADVV